MVGKRKYQKKGKKGAKRRNYRKRSVAEKASLTCTRSYSLLTANQMYQMYNMQLSNFTRAVDVAKSYQLYRIKNIKVIVQPLSDTFIAGGGTTVPYLYYMIDRTKNLVNARTSAELKQLGAKPHRIDERIVTFQWRPSVLTAQLDTQPPPGQSTSQFTSYKVSPWLNTRDADTTTVWNPDSTDHQGMVYLFENAGGGDVPVKVEVMVEFEFKKPSLSIAIKGIETAPDPIDIETLAIEA